MIGKGLRITAASLLLAASTAASAVMITDQSAITSAGQTFTYSFAGLTATSSDHIMTLFGRGDFTISAGSGSGETATWDLDGLLSSLAHPFAGIPASLVTTEHSLQDVSFSATYLISGASMATMTADGSIDVTLETSSGVNIIDANSFLGFSLASAAVPAPASAILMGLGLLGLAGAVRGKRDTAQLQA